MSGKHLSPFTLADSQLLELKVVVDIQSAGITSCDDTMDISTLYLPLETSKDGKDVGQFNLKVDYRLYPSTSGKRKRKPKPLIDLSIVLRCVITAKFDDNIPKKEREFLLKANALSILYGEARTHLASLTALSPSGKVMLRTIDPFAVIEHAENDG
jgi:hypothetical protein